MVIVAFWFAATARRREVDHDRTSVAAGERRGPHVPPVPGYGPPLNPYGAAKPEPPMLTAATPPVLATVNVLSFELVLATVPKSYVVPPLTESNAAVEFVPDRLLEKFAVVAPSLYDAVIVRLGDPELDVGVKVTTTVQVRLAFSELAHEPPVPG